MNCPYCKTPIDEHEASRCLDAWFLETVMGQTVRWAAGGWTKGFPEHWNGLRYIDIPAYSTSIAVAWAGLLQCCEDGKLFWSISCDWSEMNEADGHRRIEVTLTTKDWEFVDGRADYPLLPLASARACIKVKLAEKERQDD